MIASKRFAVVLVTAPDLKTARALAGAALRERLVACVNLVPAVESHYWWKGKLERSKEVLMVCKTIHASLTRLEKLIVAGHPYDTPEFVVLPIVSGNARYLDWLTAMTSKSNPRSQVQSRGRASGRRQG